MRIDKVRKKRHSSEIGINGLNSISNLEAEIMKIVWEKNEVTVREVHEEILRKEIGIKDKGFTPYTTIMSTMTHLAKKKILDQNRIGKTYIYTAEVDKQELSKSLIHTIADTLLEGAQKELVSKFLSDTNKLSKKNIEKFIKKLDNE